MMQKQSRIVVSCIILVFLTSSLMACSSASINKGAVQIKSVIFLNTSDKPLTDVQIYVTKTRELMSCGYILPRSECSTGFPLREYQGNRFDVSWTEGGQIITVDNILVDVPGNLRMGKPVNVVITFGKYNRFSARLQQ